jgi:hypothetical protein
VASHQWEPGGPYIPLGDVLGEKDLRHYLRFIQGAGANFYVFPGISRDGRTWRWEASAIEPRQGELPTAEEEAPQRIGMGPDTASSCMDLALCPEWCWDVCGYYSTLGVPWTAGRRELRVAYQARGGPDDEELTYILHQLLDPQVRRAYDLTPPGALFLGDRKVQEQVKRAAARMAAEAAARGAPCSPDDILAEQGFTLVKEQPALGAPGRPWDARAGQPDWERSWSWYLARGGREQQSWRLKHWQQLLIRELHDKRAVIRFAVGLCGGEGFVILSPSGQRPAIVLLGSGFPSQEKAASAAAGLMSLHPRHSGNFTD